MLNIKKFTFLFSIALCSTALYAAAQDTYPFESPNDASRFNNLTQNIRCVVCQNQNIADSAAPLANDLREKVYRMVVEQKSDQEIEQYLVKRYGEFILLKPRLSATTVLLWGFPLFGLLGGAIILRKILKASH